MDVSLSQLQLLVFFLVVVVAVVVVGCQKRK